MIFNLMRKICFSFLYSFLNGHIQKTFAFLKRAAKIWLKSFLPNLFAIIPKSLHPVFLKERAFL